MSDTPERGTRPGQKQTKITISRETTRLTAPLDERGYVDYVAAINQQMSEDVTPETNAAMPFWQALGPGPVPIGSRDIYFRRLGIEPMPEADECFVSLHDHARQRGAIGPQLDRLHEDFSRTLTRPWTDDEFPAIAMWLRSNAIPLARLCDGLQRPRAWFPCAPAIRRGREQRIVMTSQLPAAQVSRMMVRVLCSWAMLHLGEGKIEEAHRDLMDCHRLATHISSGLSLIEQLVAIADHAIAFRTEAVLATSGELSAEQARKFRSDLEALDVSVNLPRAVDTGARYLHLDAVCVVAQGDPEKMQLLFSDGEKWRTLLSITRVDWDIVLKMVNEHYDRLVAIARMPDHGRRAAEAREVETDLLAKKKLFGLPGGFSGGKARKSLAGRPTAEFSQVFGDLIICHLAPAVNPSFTAETRLQARTDLTRLAYALAAFHADHGKYPDRLAELVPRDIGELPDDPFTGQPLRYQREGDGFLLYSVGEDAMDDGGADRQSDPPGDDIVIRAAAVRAE